MADEGDGFIAYSLPINLNFAYINDEAKTLPARRITMIEVAAGATITDVLVVVAGWIFLPSYLFSPWLEGIRTSLRSSVRIRSSSTAPAAVISCMQSILAMGNGS